MLGVSIICTLRRINKNVSTSNPPIISLQGYRSNHQALWPGAPASEMQPFHQSVQLSEVKAASVLTLLGSLSYFTLKYRTAAIATSLSAAHSLHSSMFMTSYGNMTLEKYLYTNQFSPSSTYS